MRLTPPRSVILVKSSLTLALAVLPLRSRQAQNSVPTDTVCGTINTEFTEGCCIHINFGGEVSATKNFDRPFGALRFRLNSEQALGGWWIEVIPAEHAESAIDEYVWVVTPPYHFGNVRYLDTSYGTRAEDSVRESPRDFNFVLDREQYHRAADLVNLGVSSRPHDQQKFDVELDHESQNALAMLETLPVGKGRLQILDSRVDRSAGQDELGAIEWLKFRVELHVPCNFTVSDSPGLSIDRTQCSSEGKKP
jgi:hypothetical protein